MGLFFVVIWVFFDRKCPSNPACVAVPLTFLLLEVEYTAQMTRQFGDFQLFWKYFLSLRSFFAMFCVFFLPSRPSSVVIWVFLDRK
jgi:hypothetical protein